MAGFFHWAEILCNASKMFAPRSGPLVLRQAMLTSFIDMLAVQNLGR